MKKLEKKLSDLDKYVRLCLYVLIIYTIIAVTVQLITGQEISPTLTTCVFSAFGGELFLLAMIKKLKLKRGEEKNGIYSEQLGADVDSTSGNSRAD